MPRAKKNQRKTLVNYIVDESGSMQVIADQVRSGFKEYVDELKKDEGNVSLTLTKFSSDTVTAYVAKPVAEIDSIDYRPSGFTALYDAIGKTIRATEDQVDENTKVITVIMTDGGENASQEFTESSVNALITEKQNEGNWTFVFLGADQDAWATASRIGVSAGNTMSYASSNHAIAMRSVATATTTATASAGGQTYDFFTDAGQTEDDYKDNSNSTT